MQQLAALAREHDAAQAELEAKLEASAAGAARDAAASVQQLAALARELDAAQAKLEASTAGAARDAAVSVQQLAALAREHDAAQAELEASTVAAARVAAEQSRARSERWKDEIDSAKQGFATSRAAQVEKLVAANERVAVLEAVQEALRKAHDVESAAAVSGFTGLEAQLEAEVTARQAAAAELEVLQAKHAREVRVLGASAEAEKTALTVHHASALRNAREDLERFRAEHELTLQRHVGSAQEMQVELTERLVAEEDKSAAKHAARVAAEEAHASTQNILAAARVEHAVVLAAADDREKALRTQRKLLAAARAEHATTRQACADREHSLHAECEALHLAHAVKTEASAASFADLGATAAAEVATAQAAHARAVDDAATELGALRAAHAEELRSHRASAEAEQAALERTLRQRALAASDLHASALSDAAKELERVRAVHVAELAGHTAAAEETQAALAESLRVEHETSAARHAAHAAAEDAAASALAELEAELAAKAAAMQAAHSCAIGAAAAELAAYRAAHTVALDEAASELERAAAAHVDEVAALEEHRATLSARLEGEVAAALNRVDATESEFSSALRARKATCAALQSEVETVLARAEDLRLSNAGYKEVERALQRATKSLDAIAKVQTRYLFAAQLCSHSSMLTNALSTSHPDS